MGDFGDELNWENLFNNEPVNDLSIFDASSVPVPDGLSVDELFHSSPESVGFTIGEIERLLMTDDGDQNDVVKAGTVDHQLSDNNGFFSDILLDSPARSDHSGQVIDVSDGKDFNNSEEDKVDGAQREPINNNDEDGDDPISKKRKRQLRNRDAAVRSRERRKMYVDDLEMKSRYYEAECRRLGMLLQCCFAENQALRLSLFNKNAYDASRTKQESAVLLLESLLLGSLLWFLAIICLLPSVLVQSTLDVIPQGSEESRSQGSLALRKATSKNFGSMTFPSQLMGKRCKASRSRMKSCPFAIEVLVCLI